MRAKYNSSPRRNHEVTKDHEAHEQRLYKIASCIFVVFVSSWFLFDVLRIMPPVHRFFAPTLDPGDETVTLPKDEAEHLTRVLRLGVGDTVAVFDGRGHEFVARVASALRREVRVQIVSRVEPAAESGVP